MNKLPQIRIQDGWLLRENASKYLNELWGEGKMLADDAKMAEIVRAYDKAWQPYEQKVLEAITNITNLQFRQNIIDVYIAPWFSAFSNPMVIGVTSSPDEFIDFLTHELIHRLLTDNTSIDYEIDLVPRWQKLFGEKHSFGTLIHIPVHAIHKQVYLDYLKESKRLKRDISMSKMDEPNDYADSWRYVEENGYKEIIKQLKVDYKNGD